MINKDDYTSLHDAYKALMQELEALGEFFDCDRAQVTEGDLLLQQILDTLKEGFSATLSGFTTNVKSLFEGLLKHRLFSDVKNFDWDGAEKDPYEQFNEEILEQDLESLMNEMRFYNTIRSLAEDLEARLINYLSSLQSKNKRFDAPTALREIIDISLSIKAEWAKSHCKNE